MGSGWNLDLSANEGWHTPINKYTYVQYMPTTLVVVANGEQDRKNVHNGNFNF